MTIGASGGDVVSTEQGGGVSALESLTRDGLSLGIELPLDNDLARRARPGAGVMPDLTRHRERAQLADKLGFGALWLRDVPMWMPHEFGDAGQIYDPLPYLGYLAASTKRILLGTAGVVLPLRHPIILAKETATVDALSGGRLLLGLASGDRPGEYPHFGADYSSRGQRYREFTQTMRDVWSKASEVGVAGDTFLPAPVHGTVPLIGIGGAQQGIQWIAEHMDAYMTYYRRGAEMGAAAAQWSAMSSKPFMTNLYLDLVDDPSAPSEPRRLGMRVGTNGLLKNLHELETAGVAHVNLVLRSGERDVEDVMNEIGESVLPQLGHERHNKSVTIE